MKAEDSDAVVIGGGIVGMALAAFLAEAGRDVMLVDRGEGGGSTANAGSLHVQMQSRFMQLYPENVPGMERQLPLYPKATRFWQALETRLGADFELKKNGGLMVAENRQQLDFLHVKAERERKLGLSVDVLERDALERIAPYFGPAVVGAEICHDEGKLNPLRANAALRAHALAEGVRMREGCAVTGLARETDGYRVTLSDAGTVRCATLVLAAAEGTGKLAAMLGVTIPTRAEPLHMNITEAAAPMIGHLIQHADRMITLKQFATGQIVIGGGWPAHIADGRGVPRTRLDSMIANVTLASHIVPAVSPLRIIRTWAGINTSVDGKGVLGPVTTHPGLYIAVPGDAGYTLGPLSARLVCDTILGLDPGEDLSDYSPMRFA